MCDTVGYVLVLSVPARCGSGCLSRAFAALVTISQ
jgi:hypothetical protein